MTPTRAEATRSRRRRGLFWFALLFAAVWIVADQLVKWWAESSLTRGESREFIPGVLEFRLVYNPGAAFSFATNATGLLTVFAAGVVIFLIVMARRLGSLAWTIALGLLLGGAAGNLIDRLFRDPGPGRGHVVDMFRFQNFPFFDFPVFNVADIGVTSAAVLIILLALLGIAPDGSTQETQEPQEDSVSEAEPEEAAGASDEVAQQAEPAAEEAAVRDRDDR